MFGNPVEYVNGIAVDWRWEDETTKNDPLAVCIRRNMFVQAPKFYFFMAIDFLIVVIGMSFVPIGALLALARGTMGVHGAMWCFAVTAGCGVVNYWLHPHTQQLAYEAAVQENQKARVAYIAGDKEEAQRCLNRAIELTQPKVV